MEASSVPSINITPSTPTVSPLGTPKKKIQPPVTVKTPGLKRAIDKLMSSVESNRLLDENIELKGEINQMKILNEDLQGKLQNANQMIEDLQGELTTLRGELRRKKRKSAVLVTKARPVQNSRPAPIVKATKASNLRAQAKKN